MFGVEGNGRNEEQSLRVTALVLLAFLAPFDGCCCFWRSGAAIIGPPDSAKPSMFHSE